MQPRIQQRIRSSFRALDRKGVSLIGAAIAILLVGGAAVFLLQGQSQILRIIDRTRNSVVDEKIKKFIRGNIDCRSTIKPGGVACVDGDFLTVYDTFGRVLVSGIDGTLVGTERKVRAQCKVAPSPFVRFDVAKVENGQVGEWVELFPSFGISCVDEPIIPPVGPCTVTDVSATFNAAQISTALGLPSTTWVFRDGFHALMVCDRLGYDSAESLVGLAIKSSNCVGQTLAAYLATTRSYVSIPACDSTFQFLDSVTCRYQRSAACPNPAPCPPRRKLLTYGTRALIASHFGKGGFYSTGKSKCLHTDGTIKGPPNCPGTCSRHPDAAKKICDVLGYSKVMKVVSSTYSKCGDDNILHFNPSLSVFQQVEACTDNGKIDEITCETPKAATCSTWY